MKRRIAISAGHSNISGKDQGAASDNYIEGKMTVELRNLIVDELKKAKVPVSIDPDSNVTYQTVALFKKYFGIEDILVDIHFNAGPKTATGTEVLIPASYDIVEYNLAQELSRAIASCINIPNRGVKTELQSARKKLLWMSIPAKTVLIEVCFISNPDDMQKYTHMRYLVAERIADILIKYKNI